MAKMIRIACAAAPCMALTLLAACGGSSTDDVSATAGPGGSIVPTFVKVDKGASTTFTVTPNTGYTISGVTGCGGTLSGNTYTTGAITGGCNVAATFVAQYTVTATGQTGGTISPSTATVNAGGTTTFTVTPGTGFITASVTGCGGSLSGTTYTTGAISGSCIVTASFLAQYKVTASAGAGGTISPSSATVNARGTTTFNVLPGNGYAISGVTGCGGTLSGNTYTTGTINADCSVMASFAAALTWVGGSTTGGVSGLYGTQDVAAAANVPGARNGAMGWTDSSGNLWLFGGFGLDATGTSGPLGDLWKYSPSSGEWTWIGGSNAANTKGMYGVEGTAAASNAPGARGNASSWMDSSGNLWVFGGRGDDATGTLGELNDLWKYSASSGEWTWIGGSNTANAPGVYGAKGIAAAGNVPGARRTAATWMDSGGNVWLFGGQNESAGTLGYLSDLWEYTPASGQWTWIGGSNTADINGVYGTQGVPASTNLPGARYAAVTWVDASGNAWLYGGYGYDSAGTLGYLNDLWEYSPSISEWTWVGGSDIANPTGVYGTQGVTASTNVPGARSGAVSWKDANGKLWLLGGHGYDSRAALGELNDLWAYSPSSGEWTWVGGSNTANASGIYGSEGTTAATSLPGGRDGASAWTDSKGNLWLFGGYGYDSNGTLGNMNDLWEYPIQ